MVSKKFINKILEGARSIAVVGVSENQKKISFKVFNYLLDYYDVIPVNPFAGYILGKKSYPNILKVRKNIDIVNIFRPSDEVYLIVTDAIKVKPVAIWMQTGIRDERSKTEATKHGIDVVMDRCIMREHKRYLAEKAKLRKKRKGDYV